MVHRARRADQGARADRARGRRGGGREIGPGRSAPAWIRPGDLNGFLGLALDNTTNLVILGGLLIGVFKFPAELVLYRMVPGTALGALAGNLAYTRLAVRLMRTTGREDVTAMPFGIDTPTLFAMVFGVLGPVMVATGDPGLAWKVGMVVTIAIGIVKTALAFAGDFTRRVVPRAALLGSIGGVAILLIAFLPSLKVFGDPLVGMVALVVLFLALFGRVRMPFGVPGAFAAVVAGAALYWGRAWLGADAGHALDVRLQLALPWPTLVWLDALDDALPYLSVALPFALVTVVGGIDNTESAAAAGDAYPTRDILMTEALATILAGGCGGVIQNTPYIGHPAYKAMGARAGYTLATGVVIGAGAAVGALAVLVAVLPEAAVAPILIFIGLEITAQAFLATPARHGAAVALTFVPVAAAVVVLQGGSLLAGVGKSASDLTGDARATWQTLTMLGNGFILSAVLWGSALTAIIERRFAVAGVVFAIASGVVLFGVIHSPLANGAVFWPWSPPNALPLRLAGAYGALAVLCWLAARRMRAVS
ncbi:MAG: MFS transporter [Candidatus Rokubacteria bacterium]|nr:MFS transporter [Candidatus Rokubacteria bacterium]